MLKVVNAFLFWCRLKLKIVIAYPFLCSLNLKIEHSNAQIEKNLRMLFFEQCNAFLHCTKKIGD